MSTVATTSNVIVPAASLAAFSDPLDGEHLNQVGAGTEGRKA
jgi:hypothetical protein